MTETDHHRTRIDLETAIAHNPHLSNKFQYNFDDGQLLLKGRVNSYFEKQMAQESFRNVDGVAEIKNELVVDWS